MRHMAAIVRGWVVAIIAEIGERAIATGWWIKVGRGKGSAFKLSSLSKAVVDKQFRAGDVASTPRRDPCHGMRNGLRELPSERALSSTFWRFSPHR
jgi:hypothetical protein